MVSGSQVLHLPALYKAKGADIVEAELKTQAAPLAQLAREALASAIIISFSASLISIDSPVPTMAVAE